MSIDVLRLFLVGHFPHLVQGGTTGARSSGEEEKEEGEAEAVDQFLIKIDPSRLDLHSPPYSE
tara:strand:- start:986 stop:1174 length:189 start_codon:yes stop_codon:yes gene_type:complete